MITIQKRLNKVELYHIQNCIMSNIISQLVENLPVSVIEVNELRNVESKNILNILNILNYERIKC